MRHPPILHPQQRTPTQTSGPSEVTNRSPIPAYFIQVVNWEPRKHPSARPGAGATRALLPWGRAPPWTARIPARGSGTREHRRPAQAPLFSYPVPGSQLARVPGRAATIGIDRYPPVSAGLEILQPYDSPRPPLSTAQGTHCTQPERLRYHSAPSLDL